MADRPAGKRPYARPRIVHTETLTARATTCSKGDSSCMTGGAPGPIQS